MTNRRSRPRLPAPPSLNNEGDRLRATKIRQLHPLQTLACGDPALDLAHMMAHLFLASVHHVSSILVEKAGYFHSGYAGNIEEFDKLSLMHRAGPLTVAFMLDLLEDEQASSFLEP